MTTQQFLSNAWDWNPGVLIACGVALAVHAVLFRATRKIVYLIAGLAVFLVTLVSPIQALANGYLFSAHMLQHLLLLLVVPPLVLLSLQPASRWSDDAPLRGPRLIHPVVGWLAGLSAMWLWHAPALCNAATQIQAVRRIQTVSLLVLGAMFWWPVLRPRVERRLPPLIGVVYLASACLGCSLLGIILTFSPVQVCSVYMHPIDRLGILPLIRDGWGFTPAKDQQLGGLMMWVPACGVYFGAILGMLSRWYRSADADAEAADADHGSSFSPPAVHCISCSMQAARPTTVTAVADRGPSLPPSPKAATTEKT